MIKRWINLLQWKTDRSRKSLENYYCIKGTLQSHDNSNLNNPQRNKYKISY